MKIAEVTSRSRVSRVQGNKVTVDHGDGTETTIDTQKNPDALSQDDKDPNTLTVRTDQGNSGPQNTPNRNNSNRPRVGQKVQART